jgi:hypothetical protein
MSALYSCIIPPGLSLDAHPAADNADAAAVLARVAGSLPNWGR